MADTKITEMPAGTLSADDLLTFVDNPSGTPANKKIAYSSLESGLSLTSSQISDIGTYATEAYVDATVAGLYDHKGGYDASANSPDLDTSPSGILKGDAYTVSSAGTFFTAAVDAGDVLIADQDSPTLETHWTIVNRNIDESAYAAASHTHTDMLLADGTRANTGIQELLGLNLTDATELTIASGAITVTQSYHTIDTESDAATDDLDTITVAGGEGDVLVIRPESSSRTVVVKHGTGNVQCVGGDDITLDDDYDFALCVRKDASNWMAFSAGTTGGGSSSDCCLVTTAKTAPYTAAAGDLVVCDASGGAFTVTFPAAPSADDKIGVYVESGSPTLAITVAGNGKTLANFGASKTLQATGDILIFQYDGTAWVTVSRSSVDASGPGDLHMAGRWYGQRLMGGGITSAVEGGNANRMVFVPFTVPRTHTYTGIGLQCTTLDTGKYVRLAIYKDNGTPGNKELMYQTSELSLNGVGDKSETGLTIELPAGAYWLAYVQNGVAQFQAAEQADVIQNLGFANVNDLNSGVCVHYGYTYAAFPATSDAYALASPQTSANTPLIRVQA